MMSVSRDSQAGGLKSKAEGESRAGERPKGPARRIHWHVAFTHFPISLFSTAFLFQLLHFFIYRDAFELATSVCVIAGAISLAPATISGWFTWKRYFRGSKALIFRRKILVAFIMLAVSIPQATWRVALHNFHIDVPGITHVTFFFATALLIAGAIIEGYIGGRLAHH
jgi:hypothetical protein